MECYEAKRERVENTQRNMRTERENEIQRDVEVSREKRSWHQGRIQDIGHGGQRILGTKRVSKLRGKKFENRYKICTCLEKNPED